MIPEIPFPGLSDAAMITWFKGRLPTTGEKYEGPLIYFNPMIIQQVGPHLAAFFQAHEYGHAELGHIKPRFFLRDMFSRSWMNPELELEADSFATQVMLGQENYEAVNQIVQWFQGMGPIQYVPSHPPGTARADNIIATAQACGFTWG